MRMDFSGKLGGIAAMVATGMHQIHFGPEIACYCDGTELREPTGFVLLAEVDSTTGFLFSNLAIIVVIYLSCWTKSGTKGTSRLPDARLKTTSRTLLVAELAHPTCSWEDSRR